MPRTPAKPRIPATLRNARIKCAAIRQDGIIYQGKSHREIWFHLVNEGIIDVLTYPNEQGFVTECGRYVDREEALVVARQADQLILKRANRSTLLCCEDLVVT